MSSRSIQIISGDTVKSEMTETDLKTMAEAWTEHSRGPEKKEGWRERLSEIFSRGTSASAQQSIERKQFQRAIQDHFQEAIDHGDMIIAKDKGRVIGIVRIRKLDKIGKNSPVQSDVFELGKALVLTPERGKGVYTALRAEAIRHAQNKYGNVHLLSGTKNEHVKQLNRNDGWEEIGFSNYMRIHGYPEAVIAEDEAQLNAEGWTAFLHKPK